LVDTRLDISLQWINARALAYGWGGCIIESPQLNCGLVIP
jgi:hypothetical protein